MWKTAKRRFPKTLRILLSNVAALTGAVVMTVLIFALPPWSDWQVALRVTAGMLAAISLYCTIEAIRSLAQEEDAADD